MERRVAGIIKWLERCIKAYKDGAVENALMDAECARADIEILRGELWKKAENRARTRVRRFSFLKTAEAFLLACGIMLLAATPLALQQDRPTRNSKAEEYLTLEWITPDERELLTNLRRAPVEPLAMVIEPERPIADVLAVPIIAVEPAVLERRVEPARRRSPEPPPRVEQVKQTERREQMEPSLSYDRILWLIETGERAMNNDIPAIRVEVAQ